MLVIIPMSGTGNRFIEAGYSDPKPLIPVLGKPIIEWVAGMFPKECEILFICREDHLKTTAMRQVLERIRPAARILSVPGHKLGPVHSLCLASAAIPDETETLVSYCDYYMHWNYEEFAAEVSARECSGAIPCYTGFHPHLIPTKNVYASCRVDENSNLLEIREKFSFEKDKARALHSPGLYYFRSGKILKDYSHRLIQRNIQLNGEFYVSLIYNLLVQDGLKTWVPTNVTKFCQWGTPEDLREFLVWEQMVNGGTQ